MIEAFQRFVLSLFPSKTPTFRILGVSQTFGSLEEAIAYAAHVNGFSAHELSCAGNRWTLSCKGEQNGRYAIISRD